MEINASNLLQPLQSEITPIQDKKTPVDLPFLSSGLSGRKQLEQVAKTPSLKEKGFRSDGETVLGKGKYDSVEQALGKESIDLLKSDQTEILTELNCSEDERPLISNQNKNIVVKRYRLEDGRLGYFVESNIEAGRKIIVQMNSINKEPDNPSKKEHAYQVQKLIVTGPSGKCVNANERIPKECEIILTTGAVEKEEGDINSTEHFFLRDDRINIGLLHSIEDIGYVWHEMGHAWERTIVKDREPTKREKNQYKELNKRQQLEKTKSEQELRSQARIFLKKVARVHIGKGMGSEVIREITRLSRQYNMDLEKAKQIVTLEERFASMWAMRDLSKVRNYLDLTDEIADKICNKFELAWQSYDYPIEPEAATSELVRSFTPEQQQVIESHNSFVRQITGKLERMGFSESNKISITIPGKGKYEFEYNSTGSKPVVRCSFISNSDDIKSYISRFSFEGVSSSFYSLSNPHVRRDIKLFFNNPQDFLDSFNSSKNVSDIVAVEKDMVDCISVNLESIEGIKRDQTEWLINTVSTEGLPLYFDPLTQLYQLIDSVGGASSIDSYPTALKPIERHREVCKGICKLFGSTWNMSPLIFDPNTGEPIDDWTQLVVTSRTILLSCGYSLDDMPDIYSFNNKKVNEKKVIELALKELAKY